MIMLTTMTISSSLYEKHGALPVGPIGDCAQVKSQNFLDMILLVLNIVNDQISFLNNICTIMWLAQHNGLTYFVITIILKLINGIV